MRKLLITPILMLTMVMIACSPVEEQARNTVAALGGLLASAQVQYKDTCVANPAQQTCQLINRAISGENALITATEAYCGWSTTSPPGDPSAKCTPVKSATEGLQTAIANSNSFVSQLKGVVK